MGPHARDRITADMIVWESMRWTSNNIIMDICAIGQVWYSMFELYNSHEREIKLKCAQCCMCSNLSLVNFLSIYCVFPPIGFVLRRSCFHGCCRNSLVVSCFLFVSIFRFFFRWWDNLLILFILFCLCDFPYRENLKMHTTFFVKVSTK